MAAANRWGQSQAQATDSLAESLSASDSFSAYLAGSYNLNSYSFTSVAFANSAAG
jgi:hypothetical protein